MMVIYIYYVLEDSISIPEQVNQAAGERTLSAILKKKRKLKTQNNPDKINHELNSYCLATSAIENEVDPLKWWQTHQEMFPNLSILAKKYLSVNASSVNSERLFSIAGHIVTKRRSSLKPETVNKMTFLTCNL